MRAKVTTALAGALLSSAAQAGDALSFGVGWGAPYAGLGFNLGWSSPTDIKYAAVGCRYFEEDQDKWHSRYCGAAIGWLRTDWLSQAADQHAIGPYLGPTATLYDDDTDYGVGLTYSYFPRGIAKRGFHLGITPIIAWPDGGAEIDVSLHLGYQF